MKPKNEKIPSPNELEKEISEFLSKKFGGNVKVVSPVLQPLEAEAEDSGEIVKKSKPIEFDLKPEELIAYLDRYIVKQDSAKAILATKICTHFNRISRDRSSRFSPDDMVGKIKSNVLLIGPTGVGKTYMIKLIAQKIGVPFVKGDATKFSETGYVGGDVEDLVRDLVREADNDIELAQSGIIYIDEIDKIASSRNLVGPDVSRTGVQRALLKPMEETEVDLKVPHDPISMIQEIENFRRTGKRDRQSVNTRNILFIMSGAFNELDEIIRRRIAKQAIGFGASIGKFKDPAEILAHLKSEDLVEYGFESEFVGRLPVRAVLDRLTEADLYEILRNPNNPIILGKKLDFAAYGITVKFEDALLRHPAIAECGVIGKPDAARGMIVKAFCVLKPGQTGDAALVKALQDHVKATIAPFKYPREIEFLPSLPRTETGKLQRFKLRQL
jgi:endopeptidase Clp ATP-binding regulatory subunit ClpX